MVKDHRLSVRMIAEETGLDKCAVHRILTDHLHMRKICAKLVPKNFCGAKSEPVGNLLGFAGKTQNCASFLDKVIKGYKSWVFDYDPETKRQSSEWHTKSSPRPKKARMSRSKVETMIIIFSTAVALCTRNLYLQDRQLITSFTKMSWNDFEKGSGVSERTLQTTGCCTTITRQLTLRFQFENF